MTLVIMAAGLGSRFGGLKQIEGVGPNNETILEYSVFDAIKAGFTKIVFVIRKDFFDEFKAKITNKIKGIEIVYVFQENEFLPNRTKPLGTAHAIYSAKDEIDGPFAVINADDFYGEDAFKVLADEMKNTTDSCAIVGYEVAKTLSDYGSVKRGIITSKNGYVKTITESKVEANNDKIIALSLQDNKRVEADKETLVSMGMLLLNKKVLDYISENISIFFKEHNDEISEYLLPEVINELLLHDEIEMKILRTTSNWFGITYNNDLEETKEKISMLIKNNKYPKKLF